ncbi:hypothetical protein DFH06DRAFT_1324516 [Mycena polygramma]|nr:hypothetical protein DFH06DRAFT_1324516 [Mycena polygramma]
MLLTFPSRLTVSVVLVVSELSLSSSGLSHCVHSCCPTSAAFSVAAYVATSYITRQDQRSILWQPDIPHICADKTGLLLQMAPAPAASSDNNPLARRISLIPVANRDFQRDNVLRSVHVARLKPVWL